VTKGVIYFNKGMGCVVCLIVSAFTLRRHYNGPLTFMLEGSHPDCLVEGLKHCFNADIVVVPEKNEAVLVRKTEVSSMSPYDVSVFLDSDTVVVGKLDELFDDAEKHDLVVPHFAGWITKGRKINKRIRRYTSIVPDYIEPAVKYGKAINTGVYAYRKNSPIFKEWIDLSRKGASTGMFIPDEIACQILLPRYDCLVVDQKFNVSCRLGTDVQDKRVIHFHGKKHCRPFAMMHVWMEALVDTMKANPCEIRELIRNGTHGDRFLSHFLRGRTEGCDHWVNAIKAASEGRFDIPTPVWDATLVTAVDENYLKCLRASWPRWMVRKDIGSIPVIVFVSDIPISDSRLDFLKSEKVRLIPWNKDDDFRSHRESIFNAFVFGVSDNVTTKFWIKVDSDIVPNGPDPMFDPDDFNQDLVANRWGFTKVKGDPNPKPHWLNRLDEWWYDSRWNKNAGDEKRFPTIDGACYRHTRHISKIALERTCCTIGLAEILRQSNYGRLPCPSQDTTVSYYQMRTHGKVKYKKLQWARSKG
jgi:hypothetical protein